MFNQWRKMFGSCSIKPSTISGGFAAILFIHFDKRCHNQQATSKDNFIADAVAEIVPAVVHLTAKTRIGLVTVPHEASGFIISKVIHNSLISLKIKYSRMVT